MVTLVEVDVQLEDVLSSLKWELCSILASKILKLKEIKQTRQKQSTNIAKIERNPHENQKKDALVGSL